MKKLIAPFLAALLLSPLAGAEQSKNFELMASTSSYNRLVFPVPYERIVIPQDAQLRENPISLKGNLGLLVRPSEGARPIDIFVQLVDGRAFNITLIPSADPNAAVFRYDNADDVQLKPEAIDRANDGWIADAFVLAAQGKKPLGFEISRDDLLPIKAVIKPNPIAGKHNISTLNQLDMQPIKKYSGSGHTISIYRLHAKGMINIEPRDFYRQGIVAVSVDGDVVGPDHTPLVIILEEKHGF